MATDGASEERKLALLRRSEPRVGDAARGEETMEQRASPAQPAATLPGLDPPAAVTLPRAGDVLVVDDDPYSVKLLDGYLSHEGLRVRLATNGPDAIRAAHERVPDVVFLDVMMPGMTGFEVCQALKGHPRTRLVQIMLVTALGSTADRVTGLDTGADDYVTKPIRREEFLAKTRALLRVRGLLLELEAARRDLASRNEELQLKKSLAQSLVHDLKGPVCGVIGNLDLIATQTGSLRQRALDSCRTSAQRMHDMVLDLLDVESLEEGRLVPKPEPVEVGRLVEAAAAEVPVHAAVEVVVEAGQTIASADPRLLRRVVDNLLHNAVDHSPSGATVRVTVSAREEGIELTVADQGPGIPEQDRERVFEKYAQLDLHRRGVTANRGLGLSFCRLAVEAHGGTIWIEDSATGGALFRTVLPAAMREEARDVAPLAVCVG